MSGAPFVHPTEDKGLKALHDGESPLQVGTQIGGVLEPNRQPHDAIADAELGALFGPHTLVRGGRGMCDQALRIAQVIGNIDQ